MSTKVKFATVDVRRSELCTIQVSVPQWEVPLLQAVHGPAGVSVVRETVEEAELPEAGAEYKRLEDRYPRTQNKDGSIGDPVVFGVYGQFAAGIMNLQRNMEAAVAA